MWTVWKGIGGGCVSEVQGGERRRWCGGEESVMIRDVCCRCALGWRGTVRHHPQGPYHRGCAGCLCLPRAKPMAWRPPPCQPPGRQPHDQRRGRRGWGGPAHPSVDIRVELQAAAPVGGLDLGGGGGSGQAQHRVVVCTGEGGGGGGVDAVGTSKVAVPQLPCWATCSSAFSSTAAGDPTGVRGSPGVGLEALATTVRRWQAAGPWRSVPAGAVGPMVCILGDGRSELR